MKKMKISCTIQSHSPNRRTQTLIRALVAVTLTALLFGCATDEDPNEEAAAEDDASSTEAEDDDTDSDELETSDETEDVEPVILTVADHLPEGHVGSVEGAQYFMDRVTELTDGSVEFEYFPGGQLGGAADMLSLVEAGTTDIGLVSPTHFDARMPLSGVFALPGLFESAEQGTAIYAEMLFDDETNSLRQVDFGDNQLVPLVHAVLEPYQITSTQPVTSVDDLSGMLVRSGTAAQELLLEDLGASPVSISGPETYEALERGTLEATLFGMGTIASYALNEVADYNTLNAPTGAAIIGYSIRQSTFDSLPPEDQQAMLEAARETSIHLSQQFDASAAEASDSLDGLEWYEFSNEELDEWQAAAAPVWDTWTEELESRGYPGQEVLDAILERL